jgi:hypothetical protein
MDETGTLRMKTIEIKSKAYKGRNVTLLKAGLLYQCRFISATGEIARTKWFPTQKETFSDAQQLIDTEDTYRNR